MGLTRLQFLVVLVLGVGIGFGGSMLYSSLTWDQQLEELKIAVRNTQE